jgi:two-component system, LytTR family, sensor kinase
VAVPLLKTTRFRFIFAACWLCIASLHAFVLNHYGVDWKEALYDSAISYTLMAAVALLISVSLQHYLPERNRYSYVACLVVTLTLIWLFISRVAIMFVNDGSDYSIFFSQSLIIRAMFGLLVLGCMALISVLYYTIQDQQEIQKRRVEAEALSKEAELYKLRQQLQPHFLFNSLNSINALISVRPEQARTMIQQLSDFLRGTLKKEENQWVSVDEELQQLHLYLDIEKVRFGHRLSTEIVNEAAGDGKMPAMLLQPVVENAIKFGLYDTTGDICINMRTWQQDGLLWIEVKNPFDNLSNSSNKGIGFGLKSVERRLDLLFARKDLLQTRTEGDIYITTIKIPQPK